MQIPTDKKSQSLKIISALTIIILLVSAVVSMQNTSKPLEIETVSPSYDYLQTTVSAFGSLQPKVRHSILAQVDGIIENIYKRPGDKVSQGDLIIELVNPKLNRSIEQEKLLLQGKLAELEKMKATQRQLLQKQESKVLIAQYDLTISQSKLEAQNKLAALSIVSSLDLQQAELNQQKAKLFLEQEKYALDALKAMQKAEMNAYEFELQRATKQLELLERDKENLKIRAGQKGVIVKLNTNLEAGLNIQEDTMIGQIADPASLFALLRVQASQASLLELNQSVDIKIKGQHVSGLIERISPNVENSTVEVEVKFTQVLPSHSISNMSVTANIHYKSKDKNLLLVKPKHINYAGTNTVLVKNEISQRVKPQQITVGWIGEQHIQILEGLAVNDEVVLTDPREWDGSL
ncbi:hypothetical protein C1E24_12130 [Pseudoalteromonas phenolica]|uniref:Uncharacterized protein n=1 Tax=Pseudoalteromonas phenolica TaxID=161398 RepID=A0A5R9Q3C0_9GAMM|nr:efflux RND transporter periplasmic adaptor subunit [Pseudoalteromonas phenolica]TLX46749.1 hypothetical protein C1E24_12130 [Pseudoalteromonas phenolica]